MKKYIFENSPQQQQTTTKIENITRGSDKYPRALKDQNDKTTLARSAVKLESHKNHFISEIKYQIYSSQMFFFVRLTRVKKKDFPFFFRNTKYQPNCVIWKSLKNPTYMYFGLLITFHFLHDESKCFWTSKKRLFLSLLLPHNVSTGDRN